MTDVKPAQVKALQHSLPLKLNDVFLLFVNNIDQMLLLFSMSRLHK